MKKVLDSPDDLNSRTCQWKALKGSEASQEVNLSKEHESGKDLEFFGQKE
jgi:hypothetical protein